MGDRTVVYTSTCLAGYLPACNLIRELIQSYSVPFVRIGRKSTRNLRLNNNSLQFTSLAVFQIPAFKGPLGCSYQQAIMDHKTVTSSPRALLPYTSVVGMQALDGIGLVRNVCADLRHGGLASGAISRAASASRTPRPHQFSMLSTTSGEMNSRELRAAKTIWAAAARMRGGGTNGFPSWDELVAWAAGLWSKDGWPSRMAGVVAPVLKGAAVDWGGGMAAGQHAAR